MENGLEMVNVVLVVVESVRLLAVGRACEGIGLAAPQRWGA